MKLNWLLWIAGFALFSAIAALLRVTREAVQTTRALTWLRAAMIFFALHIAAVVTWAALSELR